MAGIIFGKHIYRLDSVPSTQDVLKEQFLQGAAEGTIVIALEQTLGRGRQKRSWDSPAGKGLWTSVLVMPEGPEELCTWVSLWAGMVVRNAIEELLRESQVQNNILLKWPNDLFINERKLGGILAENLRDPKGRRALVLGLGINLLQRKEDFPPHLRGVAVSLSEATGQRYFTGAVLEKFILIANEMYALLKPIDPIRIRQLWMAAAWGLNEKFRVISGSQVYEGSFIGLGLHGEMCLKGDDGEKRYFSTVEGMQRMAAS